MHSNPHPQSPHQRTTLRRKRRKFHGPGRPRVLDDGKRREICALIAGGCGLRDAARYVNCDVSTIRREADRNPSFADQLRQSESYAQLSPLRAMQKASGTHWRAAAWMLERAFPDRFARPEPGAFGARQARQLMNAVLKVVSSETLDPFKYDRLAKRIKGAFEYHIHVATDRRRTTQNLRRAMSSLEQRDRVEGPLAEFGIPTPDFGSFRSSTVRRGSPDPAPTATKGVPPQSPRERPLSEFTARLRDELRTRSRQTPAATGPRTERHKSSTILQRPSTTERQ